MSSCDIRCMSASPDTLCTCACNNKNHGTVWAIEQRREHKTLERWFQMTKKEFLRALKDGDFAMGDSFWLDDIEFEVINKNHPNGD